MSLENCSIKMQDALCTANDIVVRYNPLISSNHYQEFFLECN